MFTGKKLFLIIVYLHLLVCSVVFANKSVFIISQHVKPSQAQAYAINGDQVTLQGNNYYGRLQKFPRF